MTISRITLVLSIIAFEVGLASPVLADPLSGEILKFQQLPLNSGLGPSLGGAPYEGHDVFSTAYPGPVPGTYVGRFAADDFSDNFSAPVVHVKWWGSYQNNVTGTNGVQNFLISFESDQPVQPGTTFSHPNQPLLNQIVTAGPLSPASGTFTESLINSNVTEDLYQYNAELAFPFPQQADVVYWLKIVAMVDPNNDGNIAWGWHNRDWGIQDLLASAVPVPGEFDEGPVTNTAGNPTSVWHFQDDAVDGQVTITGNAAFPPQPIVSQSSMAPLLYLENGGTFPTDGPSGIELLSEDLAFELYTVPEPTTMSMAMIGMTAILLARSKRRPR